MIRLGLDNNGEKYQWYIIPQCHEVGKTNDGVSSTDSTYRRWNMSDRNYISTQRILYEMRKKLVILVELSRLEVYKGS